MVTVAAAPLAEEIDRKGLAATRERFLRLQAGRRRRIQAARAGARTMLVDLDRSTLTYVNHQDRTYTVAPLPLDLEAVLTPAMQEFLRERYTTGRVRATGREKKVLGHECREFEVEQWRTGSAGTTPPVPYRVYACNRVPADLAPFRVFLTCLRQLFARDEAFSKDLLQIDGLAGNDTVTIARANGTRCRFVTASFSRTSGSWRTNTRRSETCSSRTRRNSRTPDVIRTWSMKPGKP